MLIVVGRDVENDIQVCALVFEGEISVKLSRRMVAIRSAARAESNDVSKFTAPASRYRLLIDPNQYIGGLEQQR